MKSACRLRAAHPPDVLFLNQRRHCEKRSDEAIQTSPQPGLLRSARNDD
jgi:hypothetical protein